MDPNLVVGVLALLVAIYHAYHMRRHTMMLEAQNLPRAERRRGEVPTISWWKLPTIPTLAVLVVLAWTPWIYGTLFSNDTLTDLGWGSYLTIIDQNSNKATKITLFITYNGQSISRYKDTYKIIGIALHNYGNKDTEDITNLQKSTAYYIKENQQEVLIETDQSYLHEYNKGDRRTSYFRRACVGPPG